MCTPGQAPQEARGFGSPGAGVAGVNCLLWVLGTSLQEQYHLQLHFLLSQVSLVFCHGNRQH